MNQLLEKMIVYDDEDLLSAIDKIEASRFQTVFVTDRELQLKGLITNGDVRRFLLNGGQTDETVTACMNKSFRSVGMNASREEMLKLLDLGFTVIPKVAPDGRLMDLITPEYELASPEAPVLTRARAPVRISFGGGGSDLTYYFVDHPGAVLSTTVALYAHATLIPRADRNIHIYSEDLDTHTHYPSLLDLLASPRQDLLSAVVSVIKPIYGFDLYVRSDFPVGSGLGGSSAVATAVVAAFNEMRLDRWTTYEVAELAFQAERVCFGVAGGWQDQYASAFGGFNLIELGDKKNLVHAIRLEAATVNELEECLILCDSRIKHDSGTLHKKQRETYSNENKAEQLTEMVALCREMHRHLLRGELMDFGRCLDKAWQLKRGLSADISNPELAHIYESAMQAGALGGKLLGAGAGGFFLFFVQPQYRQQLAKRLKDLNCKLSIFKFENEGVVSWRTKIL
ncbi:sugar kinase [Herbaspirillum sp. C7C2]|nr:sugar kinase [Herbaspirillum sp. C7C2]ONN67020.1 sugar kinase [Herbaspirillum sp. VT-16-41]